MIKRQKLVMVYLLSSEHCVWIHWLTWAAWRLMWAHILTNCWHTHTHKRAHTHAQPHTSTSYELFNECLLQTASCQQYAKNTSGGKSQHVCRSMQSVLRRTHTHTHGADIYIYTHTHRHHAEHHLTACSVCLCSDGCVGDKIRLVVQQPFKLNDRHQQ